MSLNEYYEKLFPFDSLSKWLPFTNQRVVGLTCRGVFSRHKISSIHEFKQLLIRRAPEKIDLGAYGDHECQREFVIDIDLTDYPHRICSCDLCCQTCWQTYIVPAIRVLDRVFREDWGVDKILWMFSGRRGVHAWLIDDRFTELDNTSRRQLLSYLLIGNQKIRPHTSIAKAFHMLSDGAPFQPDTVKEVFDQVYPRLDEPVSCDRRHLLKAPFSIHPKTQRISVPIKPETCHRFDPTTMAPDVITQKYLSSYLKFFATS